MSQASSQGQEVCKDVVVIGGGWSGLVACKSMLEEGLTVVALEKRENIGGVWLYSDNPAIPTVMKSTQCTSSSTFTEMSDFPMPKEIGMFPHHTDVIKYLNDYATKFDLHPHIRLNTTVESINKTEYGWKVTCTSGDVYKSSQIVVATGQVQVPNSELQDTVLKEFTGKVKHVSQIKEPLKEFQDARVLLLGGGETSSDICFDWINHAKFIYWSIPRGQHFFRKYSKMLPWMKAQPLDHVSSRMTATISPYSQSKPGTSWACKWTTGGSVFAYQGHGIPEWKNDADMFKFFINKNGKVLDLVDYKRLVPKGAVVDCSGKQITFIDGTTQEFDLVILSTGYKVEYPFLPDGYKAGVRDRYKMVFDVLDPSLAFVGLVRPIIGSVVGIAELQARWVAKVFARKVRLENLEERQNNVETNKEFLNKKFKNSSQRLQGLVEVYTYTDDIAKQAAVYPDYWALFKQSPRNWFTAYFCPYNSAMFRLNEPEQQDQSIKTMRSHQKAAILPFPYMLALFMRLIWFDWLVNQLSKVKFRVQTSQWWPTVYSWRATQAIDYVWTAPKRMLYDNVSNDVNQISESAKHLMSSHKYYGQHLEM